MIRSPWRGRSGDIGAWRTDCTGSWMSLSARTTAGCGTAPPPATSPCCARSPSTWSPRTAAAGPAYAAGARRPPGTTTTCSSSSSATLMREPWAAHALRRRVHLAVEPHLAVAPGVGDRHRVAQLGDIDPDESLLGLGHGSPSYGEEGLVPPGRSVASSILTAPHRGGVLRTCQVSVDPSATPERNR